MKRGQRQPNTLGRVSVAVPPEIQLQAPKHPELVGLAKGASRAKVLERLIQLGWSTVLQAKRDREQLAAYAAYEADQERTAVARADHEQLARGGVL